MKQLHGVREGFPKQRLIIVPANIQQRCKKLPMVGHLYITHIGTFPSAPQHCVERATGTTKSILLYCFDGRGFLEIEGNRHSIEAGHLAIIPAGKPHKYWAAPSWSLFWIHFDGLHAELALQSLRVNAKKPLLFIPDKRIMCQAFEEVYACLNYRYSDAGLLAMTSELMRLLSRIKLHQGFLQPQRQTVEKQISDSMDYMDRHIDMSFTLEELAARAGLSAPYYSKLFKKRTDQSPMAYFIQLKIRKACELLNHTDLSVQEIAGELGYDDPYYFSRLFKKIQGCSPTAFRAIATPDKW